MKASDLFVKCLENEGVEYIFGLPGEENADMMISLKGSSIEFVLCRHEQAAAFMADVYGRLTGKAGVCLGTLGPGATNLVTGVADGNMDRAPMVVITGQADTKRLHKESHQNMDVVGMFKPITKWAHQIVNQDNIPEVVRKAFKLAEREKPGACHIELPEDLAAMDASTTPIPFDKLRRPAPDEKIIDQAMELLMSAKHPVILAGNGCVRKRAAKQLKILCEKTGIPVINTFMAKGCIPRTDPHCLYTVGLQQRDLIMAAIDEADVVVTVGYDLVEYHPNVWNKNKDKQILHVDFLPAEVDEHYRVRVEINADIASALWHINERIEGDAPKWDIGRYAELKSKMDDEFAMHKDDDTEGKIRPQKVLWDVREAMRPHDILLSDVGAHKMWIARNYQCDEPNTCLISNGFCSMGFALPGAIAAKMAHPESNVLAICGDAGVLMNIQDLETAKRLGVNIVIMVWEDHEYGLIKWKQQQHFDEHSDLEFTNPDWMKLAEAFGCIGIRVDNARDLRGALDEAFSADGPVILSLPIDYDENMKLSERLGKMNIKL